jgi:AmpD protein
LSDKESVTYAVSPGAGLLRPASQRPSPNQDARPDGVDPDTIVIHGISLPPGEFGGPEIEALFTNALDWSAHPYFGEIEGLKVSSHLLIRRDGEVVQFVPFGRRAWHAGDSRFRGRSCCNDYSIGIELEGTDDVPYTDEQYEHLVPVVIAVMRAYRMISPRTIAGHCDISPGRKSDPGPVFDWMRLYDGIATNSGGQTDA